MTTRRISFFALLVASLAATSACHRKPAGATGAPAPSDSAELTSLPPLVFKDDTPNALLTWVDDQGDFHVAEHVADVPEASRENVRVVLADRKDGTGESVYVADLRTKNPDGTYPVKTMARDGWDELGAGKRKSRLEALAPSAAPPTAAAGSANAAPNAAVTATIYGADWCGHCHEAEAFLKSLGVNVTEKNIEKSEEAAREMEAALRRSHSRGGGIPVIDVMGQVFVGFSAGGLRAAVERARSGQH